jgi:hypothetical protein
VGYCAIRQGYLGHESAERPKGRGELKSQKIPLPLKGWGDFFTKRRGQVLIDLSPKLSLIIKQFYGKKRKKTFFAFYFMKKMYLCHV